MYLISLLGDFVDLIFPKICVACDGLLKGNENQICTACRIGLPRAAKGSLYADRTDLRFIHLQKVASAAAFLSFSKRGKVQHLLHGIKYRGKKQAAVVLGQMFGEEMFHQNGFPEVTRIVTVPLHPKKLKSRGYNQSDLIAEGISRVTGIPWSGSVLKRIRHTESQTGKGREERRKNVEGVFAIEGDFKDKSVMLIDDVLTTGATLEECVEVLIGAGCAAIHIRTLAVANH